MKMYISNDGSYCVDGIRVELALFATTYNRPHVPYEKIVTRTCCWYCRGEVDAQQKPPS